jgi:hypothetical protein
MKFNREMLEDALKRKIFAWVDGVMREILPNHMYQAAHRGDPFEREKTNQWLKEKGYRIESPGDGLVRVFKGTKLIRQTRLVLELNDPEELLQIAEVAQHKNIPPPPWQQK